MAVVRIEGDPLRIMDSHSVRIEVACLIISRGSVKNAVGARRNIPDLFPRAVNDNQMASPVVKYDVFRVNNPERGSPEIGENIVFRIVNPVASRLHDPDPSLVVVADEQASGGRIVPDPGGFV
ncbi:MAG: hypothetical protein A4E74_01330 [Syntrophus sp. PtaB.Bin075]|nr:MAG: hypothetical protein A4E74_01330 [Syntrophus sp. PtaB.Bin075]